MGAAEWAGILTLAWVLLNAGIAFYYVQQDMLDDCQFRSPFRKNIINNVTVTIVVVQVICAMLVLLVMMLTLWLDWYPVPDTDDMLDEII